MIKLHVCAMTVDSAKKGITCVPVTLLRVHGQHQMIAAALHAETLHRNRENCTTDAAVPAVMDGDHQKPAGAHGKQPHHGHWARHSTGQWIAWQIAASAAQDLLSSPVSAVSTGAVRRRPGQVQTQCDASAVARQRQSPERCCAGLEVKWGTEGTPLGVCGACEQAGGLHLSRHGTESASA